MSQQGRTPQDMQDQHEAEAALRIEHMIIGNHFTEEQVERIIKLLRMVQRVDEAK